ncbi:MAG: GAF domain-containing protein, partial [Candidatus Hodarchaeales archaeon]
MANIETVCRETLIAAIENYQRYKTARKATSENQHRFLTQSAIMQQLWEQVGDRRGFRSKHLIAQTIRELEARNWLKSKKGKQNAMLYFPTDIGLKASVEYIAQERQLIDNVTGKASHFTAQNQKIHRSLEFSENLQNLRVHFEDQLRYERVLRAISGRFVSFANFSQAANTSLSDLGQLLGADRAFMAFFHDSRTWLPNHHEWCAPGIQSAIHKLEKYRSEMFPWPWKTEETDNSIWIHDEDSWPKKGTVERKLLKTQGARSLLITPILAEGEFKGILAVVNIENSYGLAEEDVRLLQVCCEIIGGAVIRLETRHALIERVKELNCLYSISGIAQQPALSLSEILKKIVKLIHLAWQYPEIAGACITFEDERFITPGFKKVPWIQSADINLGRRKVGSVAVCYAEERPNEGANEGPFLREERLLLDAIAERLSKIIERKQADEARRLSEENLRISEAKFRALAEQSLVGITIVQNEQVIYANPAAAIISGYSAEEVLSWGEAEFMKAIHPE